MPRHCTVCDYPQRDNIDGQLIKGDSGHSGSVLNILQFAQEAHVRAYT
jgi:hypothetical protein